MNKACPISLERIDEKAARLNAALVILGCLVFLLTPIKAIIYFLVADFAIKASGKGKYSPLMFFSRSILNILKVSPSMVDAKPKQFAATLGLILCLVITAAYFANLSTLIFVLTPMLIIFATLESAKGFCVGCEIYYRLQKLIN